MARNQNPRGVRKDFDNLCGTGRSQMLTKRNYDLVRRSYLRDRLFWGKAFLSVGCIFPLNDEKAIALINIKS